MASNYNETKEISAPLCPISFIGGPLDGHLETFRVSPQQLPADLICLICNGLHSTRNSGINRLKPDFTSIAVYELLLQHQGWQYHFVGPLTPTFFNRGSFSPCNALRYLQK